MEDERLRGAPLRVGTTMTAMHLSGFISDLSEAVAVGIGAGGVVWVPMPWDRLMSPEHPAYDMAVQIVTITPERERDVDFSDPFLVAGQTLLARRGGPLAGAATVEDVRPHLLGGNRGGAGIACIREIVRPGTPPKEYDSPYACGQALDAAEVDGIVFPAPVAMALSRQFKETAVVGQFAASRERYGIVFDKGNPLRDSVNIVLAEVRADGTWARIVDKWFPGIEELRALA
jgi:polar amino acid transport system substrate-binding protein